MNPLTLGVGLLRIEEMKDDLGRIWGCQANAKGRLFCLHVHHWLSYHLARIFVEQQPYAEVLDLMIEVASDPGRGE